MTLFLLAIVAGLLTVLAPCILPVLPIILGVGHGSKWRPVFVVLGFVGSFSLLGAAFATVGSVFGVSNEALRTVAIVLLAAFGLALIFQNIYDKLTARAAAAIQRISGKIQAKHVGKSGALSGLLVGLSLGLVWTPCAGPILGTILTLAATESDFITTALLFFAYAVGAGLPMLGIAYAGGWVLPKLKAIGLHAGALNKLFGLIILATAIAIAFGYDRVIQVELIRFYPEGILPL